MVAFILNDAVHGSRAITSVFEPIVQKVKSIIGSQTQHSYFSRSISREIVWYVLYFNFKVNDLFDRDINQKII